MTIRELRAECAQARKALYEARQICDAARQVELTARTRLRDALDPREDGLVHLNLQIQ